MKAIRFFFSLAASATMLTGCLSEPDFESVVDGEETRLEVALFNEIKQTPVTRVNDEGFFNGDAVGVYVVNYTDATPGILAINGNQADNVKYTLNESTGSWKSNIPVYYKDKKTYVDIYGYYPYSDPKSIGEYLFEIAKDQSQDANNGELGGYEASDFLWAKATKILPTSSKVLLQFHHLMAGVKISLVEGTGFADGEFASIDKDVLVTNTKRQTSINLATGGVVAVGDVATTATIPYKKNGEFRAIVAPQTLIANTPLFILTVDGMPYVFRKDADFEYVSGKLHKFSIEVSKKSAGGLEFKLLGESITAWESESFTHDGLAREYVIIHSETPGSLKESIVNAGKDYAKVKNLKVTGQVNSSDFTFMRDEMSMLQSINMKEVKICGEVGEDEIPSGAFMGKLSLLRFVFPDRLKKIGDYAFCETNLSGSLIIPEGVTEIGAHAFGPSWAGIAYEGGLPLSGQLSLPSTLKIIGSYAFCQCEGFSGTLFLPDGLEEIHDSAFKNCRGFTGELRLPESIRVLGGDCMYGGAFYGCSGFSGSLRIPAGLNKVGYDAFSGCNGLNGELFLPEGITEIGKGAFYGCPFRYPITLPKSLLVIKQEAFVGCQFSGTLVLPADLTVLEKYAFAGNQRLTGVVELPVEITTISEGLFSGCSQLEGVIINKNVESIKSSAFSGCYQLNSIVSHAQTPPTVSPGAFNGVAKDNFAVEVPSESVNSYKYVEGWNEFKRIAANHDFTINRNLFRSLNLSNDKTVLLRARSGESWSVRDCPDWISVSPSSGTGKTEVVISVAEMSDADVGTVNYEAMDTGGNYQNYSFEGRRHELVFALDGKDATTSIVVEQYDYEYGDGDVITVQEATIGEGVNVVFMGDCFDAKDISEGKYLEGINEAIGYYFDIEPYKTYKEYFNVYIVVGLSPDSGVGTVNTIRESRFGTQYTLNVGLAPREDLCFEAACLAPINDDVSRTLIVMIENSEDYGGVSYMWGDGSAIALCPMGRDLYPYDFRGLIQHEAGGHGFGKLGDEYIYHNGFISACPICGDASSYVKNAHSLGWYQNLSLSGNWNNVQWSHLLFDEQFQNTVDIYEGGYMHTRGVFRSEPNSCMNNNIPYYSAISRESIVKRIMKYAGMEYSFENFKENDVLTLVPEVETKSVTLDNIVTYPTNQQRPPVYMGDKPNFKK